MTAIQQQTVPALRFPEFSGDWNIDRVENYISRVGVPVSIEPEKLYREIGIRSHGRGIFHKEPVTGKSLGNKRVFEVHIPAFVVNIVFAWEHAIAVTSDNEEGFIASHRFPMFVPADGKSTLPFVRYFFIRKYGKHLLGLASPGGAGRNKTLGQKDFAKLKLIFPEVNEQQKIVSFLTSVDTKIEQLDKKKALLEQFKKGVMQKLFSQELRFKDEQGDDFPDWEEHRLVEVADCLDNKRKPLNSSERASIQGPYPYYGANGQLDSISEYIFDEPLVLLAEDGGNFDEFTNRPIAQNISGKCWVNNHAHILRAKPGVCVHEFLFYSLVHKDIRKYINGSSRAKLNKFDMMSIKGWYPKPDEQQKIANILSAFDQKIKLIVTELNQAKSFKKGLLQQMFI